FQKQVDQMGGQLSAALGGIMNPGQPKPAASAAAPSSGLGIRLWEIVPINSNAFGTLLSGEIAGLGKLTAEPTPGGPPPPPTELPPKTAHVFGGFDGVFTSKIVDENSRINVQNLDNVG